MGQNLLPFEIPDEDPIKKAQRIMNSKIEELSEEDKKIRLDYEEIKNMSFDDVRGFSGDLRSYLIDYGYIISANEMKRDFYLKNRLDKVERKNMLEFFEILDKSAWHDKLCFGYAVFGVGSSVYSEEDYQYLEDSLKKEGISLEDFVVEETWNYEGQYSDFKNYEEYFEKTKEENKGRPFDDKLPITTRENFYKVREKEQQNYKTKKKLKDVLEKKGEDLDFVICPDEWNGFRKVEDYTRNKFNEFKRNLKKFSSEAEIKYIEETSYLAGHDYRIFDGVVSRSKEIEGLENTCRIEFPKGRSFHFYFKDDFADFKLRDERIRNYPFVQLLRKSNFRDLQETISYGEKTGIYENPRILKFLGRI